MEKITTTKTAKIIITPQLSAEINILHNQGKTNAEWSGLLLYKILEGTIQEPDKLVISCHHVFPMNFAEAMFTSFEGETSWIDFFTQFPQINPIEKEEGSPWAIGKIHTHAHINSFHSGTDTQDLYDNAPAFPFFLSLVVNYNCIPFAEIAVAGEVEKQIGLKGYLSSLFLEKKKCTYVIPCKVEYEVEDWFQKQINTIKAKTPVVTTPVGFKYEDLTKRFNTQSKKEDKESKLTLKATAKIPKGYKDMLAELSDLLVLGCGTYQTFHTAPGEVIKEVNKILMPVTIENYKKAFKHYFLQVWFDEYFGRQYTEQEIIECIRTFVSQPGIVLWLTPFLKEALNELEEEEQLLRKIQGYSLV